ncbi:MAG: TolC family protein [Campylobacterales bacterium]|nr:TolC family protein [Campylobacterales bacterium]
MKKLLQLFSLLLITGVFVFGSDEILSNIKKNELDLKEKQTIIGAEILEKSWINPLTLSLSQSSDKLGAPTEIDSTKATISFNQDLFRSGGIYYAIKYANAKKEGGLYSVKYQRNLAVVNGYTILLSINKLKLQIDKQKLLIENQAIDIKTKREQFLAGVINSSLLNTAIIDQSRNENTLLDLETSYEKLIDDFKNISDKDHKDIFIPNLEMPREVDYMLNNLELLVNDRTIEENNYFKKMTVAKFMPKVTLNTYYTQDSTTTKAPTGVTDSDSSYYGYGLTFSIPLSVNSFREVESSKIDYLLAKNTLSDKKRSESNYYRKSLGNIKRIEKKIALALNDQILYDSLISQTQEQLEAQMKTEDDLKVMNNSKNIRSLDLDIYQIDKKLEILPILAKMNIDI